MVKDDKSRKKRYKSYLKSELEAAALYSALANVEKDVERREIFLELVGAEMKHAARWAEKLGMDPSSIRPEFPSAKLKLMKLIASMFGTRKVLPIVLKLEADEVAIYGSDPEAVDLVEEEMKHSRTLKNLAYSGSVDQALASIRGLPFGGSGSLRAAILGVNDGLLSNFSLVMGVAGGIEAAGISNTDVVLLAGTAGMLAGAFSMAAGEYVSMRSQTDIYENELRKEEIELQESPEDEEEELVLIYRAKGISEDESRRIAKTVMSDPQVALDTMAREELGLNPSQLGSPWSASGSSFVAFLSGAVIPILPYIFETGNFAVYISAGLSGSVLVTLGGVIAAISGRSVVFGSARMLMVGTLAAAVTFAVGSLIGVSVT